MSSSTFGPHAAPGLRHAFLGVLALTSWTELATAQTPPPSTQNEGKVTLVHEPPVTTEEAQAEDQEEEVEPHRGFFAHFDVGLGYGFVQGGALGPEPGFRPVDDLSFSGPVFGTSLQFGGGAEDFSLAAELMYELMLTEKEEPDNVGFQMFGIGLGANYYTDDDFLIGAQLRYLGMILWREDIPCFWDRGVGTSGPGIGVTLGKEWFGDRRRNQRDDDDNDDDDNEGGIGIALQGNYAAFQGDPDLRYMSLLLQLSLTHF